MKLSQLMLALGCATAVFTADAAGIRTITVEAQGVGPTREKAVTAALAEAVSRVNGLALDSRDVTRVKAEIRNKSEKRGGDASSKTTANLHEELERQTRTKTQGAVKSYQVIDVICAEQECTAKLSVDINKYEAGTQSNRLRIAVLDFRQKGPKQAMFADQVNQSMVDYLTGTRHFAVLDRDYQEERLGELQGLMRDDVRTEERARIGNSLGTDYIVTGTVEELYGKDITRKVPFTNEVVHQQEVKVVVSWRVVEAATGQILVSNTIAKKFNVNAQDADQGSIGRPIVRSIAETINDIIYPILVLSYNESTQTLILGQGGSTLTPGTQYRLVKYGALLEDPYTGEKSAREEIDVGIVQIARVTPKSAYARVLQCQTDLRGVAPREYILRAMTTEDQRAANPKPQTTMTPAW